MPAASEANAQFGSEARSEARALDLSDDSNIAQRIGQRPDESYEYTGTQGDQRPTDGIRRSGLDGSVQTDEEYENELELIYGAQHVILIFVPVIICMLVVSIIISSLSFFATNDGQYLVYTPFHPEDTDTGGEILLDSVLNALIILGVVVVMTFLLVLAYKLKCYCFMHGWVILSSLMLLFLFALIFLQELLKAYNVPMDLITAFFCVFNFGMTGLVMIYWMGPLVMQQAYLIISAALMSLIFIKYLPEWTLWVVLGTIAIWDLVAVLAPHGPLKMLVETAQERGENVMPALIYSSTVMYPFVTMADKGSQNKTAKVRKSSSQGSSASVNKNKRKYEKSPQGTVPTGRADLTSTDDTPANPENVKVRVEGKYKDGVDNQKVEVNKLKGNGQRVSVDTEEEQQQGRLQPDNEQGRQGGNEEENLGRPSLSERIEMMENEIAEESERGVKLGLGDFIFYSVLVGKASASGDIATIIACFIAILMGLFLTLAILVTVKKALPALPISIFFGLIFNFGTSYLITPMMEEFSRNQIFI